MAYELTPRLFRLNFEDGELAGLTIMVRQASFDGLEAVESYKWTGKYASMRPLIEAFAAGLVEWNLTADGAAVPCSRDEFMRQNFTFISAVVFAWAVEVQKSMHGDSATAKPAFDESTLPMEEIEEVAS